MLHKNQKCINTADELIESLKKADISIDTYRNTMGIAYKNNSNIVKEALIKLIRDQDDDMFNFMSIMNGHYMKRITNGSSKDDLANTLKDLVTIDREAFSYLVEQKHKCDTLVENIVDSIDRSKKPEEKDDEAKVDESDVNLVGENNDIPDSGQ